jgi:hypothetical protein
VKTSSSPSANHGGSPFAARPALKLFVHSESVPVRADTMGWTTSPSTFGRHGTKPAPPTTLDRAVPLPVPVGPPPPVPPRRHAPPPRRSKRSLEDDGASVVDGLAWREGAEQRVRRVAARPPHHRGVRGDPLAYGEKQQPPAQAQPAAPLRTHFSDQPRMFGLHDNLVCDGEPCLTDLERCGLLPSARTASGALPDLSALLGPLPGGPSSFLRLRITPPWKTLVRERDHIVVRVGRHLLAVYVP